MLGEGPTYGINGGVWPPEKGLVLILPKQTQNLVWVYIMMPLIVICLLMKKKSLNLKPAIELLAFHLNFVSEVFLMDLVILNLEKYF